MWGVEWMLGLLETLNWGADEWAAAGSLLAAFFSYLAVRAMRRQQRDQVTGWPTVELENMHPLSQLALDGPIVSMPFHFHFSVRNLGGPIVQGSLRCAADKDTRFTSAQAAAAAIAAGGKTFEYREADQLIVRFGPGAAGGPPQQEAVAPLAAEVDLGTFELTSGATHRIRYPDELLSWMLVRTLVVGQDPSGKPRPGVLNFDFTFRTILGRRIKRRLQVRYEAFDIGPTKPAPPQAIGANFKLEFLGETKRGLFKRERKTR